MGNSTEGTEERSFDEMMGDLNKEANRHRKKRDEMNGHADTFAAKRDRINKQIHSLTSQAVAMKERRDMCPKYSAEGQAAHEKMHQLYDEADRLRAEAEKAHQDSLVCRKAADLEHTEYVKVLDRIREFRDKLAN